MQFSGVVLMKPWFLLCIVCWCSACVSLAATDHTWLLPKIQGEVLDSVSGKALEKAHVAIYAKDGTLLLSQYTDKNGVFMSKSQRSSRDLFSNPEMGADRLLIISLSGYQSFKRNYRLSTGPESEPPQLNVGVVLLKQLSL